MATVTENKQNTAISFIVLGGILALIPVAIIFFISLANPDIWSAPYSSFALANLGFAVGFAALLGLLAPRSKVLYLAIFYTFLAATVVMLVLGFVLINSAGPLFLHIALMFGFYFMMYALSDAKQGDNMYVRVSVPALCDIAGLITVLWFIGVEMSNGVHLAIGGIIALITVIASISPLKQIVSGKAMSGILDKEITYEEEEKKPDLEEFYKETEEEEDDERKTRGIKIPKDCRKYWIFSSWYIRELYDLIYQFYKDCYEAANNARYHFYHSIDNTAGNYYEEFAKVYKGWIKQIEKEYKENKAMIKFMSKEVLTEKNFGQLIHYDFINGNRRRRKGTDPESFQVIVHGYEKTFEFGKYGRNYCYETVSISSEINKDVGFTSYLN